MKFICAILVNLQHPQALSLCLSSCCPFADFTILILQRGGIGLGISSIFAQILDSDQNFSAFAYSAIAAICGFH